MSTQTMHGFALPGKKIGLCHNMCVCVFGEEYFKNYNKMLSLIRKMDSLAHAGNPKSVLT